MENFEKTLIDKSIAVIGCGGLGGNIANLVARLNPKSLILLDGDDFSLCNLNRQLFSSKDTVGKNKAVVVQEHLKQCTDANIIAIDQFLTKDNFKLLKDVDLIFDATDSVASRFLIHHAGSSLNIPIVHGAINGTFGQVSVIYPGDDTFERLYPSKSEMEIRHTYSFVPSAIASIQVSEAVRFMAKEDALKPGEVLYIDLITRTIRKIFI